MLSFTQKYLPMGRNSTYLKDPGIYIYIHIFISQITYKDPCGSLPSLHSIWSEKWSIPQQQKPARREKSVLQAWGIPCFWGADSDLAVFGQPNGCVDMHLPLNAKGSPAKIHETTQICRISASTQRQFCVPKLRALCRLCHLHVCQCLSSPRQCPESVKKTAAWFEFNDLDFLNGKRRMHSPKQKIF